MSMPPFPVIRPDAVERMNPLTMLAYRSWLGHEMAAAAERHREILRRRVEEPIQYVDPDAAIHRAEHEALTQRQRDARRHGRARAAEGLRRAS